MNEINKNNTAIMPKIIAHGSEITVVKYNTAIITAKIIRKLLSVALIFFVMIPIFL